MKPVSPCTCPCSLSPAEMYFNTCIHEKWVYTRHITKFILLINTYSKVRDEGPLLHGLVVCGLTSHQAEVKGQSRVLRTHDHGAKRCGCVDTNVINHILWLKWKMWWSSCFDLLNTPECAVTKSPRKRASVRKLTTKRPCSLMRMLVGYREPKKTYRYPHESIYSLYSSWEAMEPSYLRATPWTDGRSITAGVLKIFGTP